MASKRSYPSGAEKRKKKKTDEEKRSKDKAERNRAFRVSSNTLHQQNNGNFSKEVELLAKFDPVMKQHTERVESGQFSHSSYLGNIIQNERIASISGKIMDTVMTEIKQSKYYSAILDCTPDVSHQEQILGATQDTRWDSRINSIEAVWYQASNIREALPKIKEVTDPLTKVEAQTLAEELGSYRFLICTVVWYDILYHVNHVSKLLQSPKMQLDVAVDLLTKAKSSLTNYRRTGFASAQASAKDMCEEMNIEAVLKQKRLRSTKKPQMSPLQIP
ncbi:uncharacterized protein [Macrobrachium rosenbergii]|uniref:uncharacterized protein n=1 Tax=Macrobrachium rosenbergii TaxID=79674 RepID=UPI0034D6FB6B